MLRWWCYSGCTLKIEDYFRKKELCIKKENLAIVLCSELLLMFQVMAYHLSILNIVWSKTYTEGVEEG